MPIGPETLDLLGYHRQPNQTAAGACALENGTKLHIVAFTIPANDGWATILCTPFFTEKTSDDDRRGTLLHELFHEYFPDDNEAALKKHLGMQPSDPALGPNYSEDTSKFFASGCKFRLDRTQKKPN